LNQISLDINKVNELSVDIGSLRLYFSYNTVIAFRGKNGLVIRENSWGNTTGKHLNHINEDKTRRISGELFEQKLNEMLKEYNLTI
jgi:hypothetical protein